MKRSLDDVIGELGGIVEDSRKNADVAGYFAALYKRVTIEVRDAIARGDFEDNDRMTNLDIRFASRYLDAYESYKTGNPLSSSWKRAFVLGSDPTLITLQHLMLGMNAHISLDLGIASAEIGVDDRLSLKSDFYAINRILENLIDDTQNRLTKFFRPLGIADKLLGSIDETLSIYSIAYARDKAWTQTLELCLANSQERETQILQRDAAVEKFARCIAKPSKLRIRLLILFIRLFERGSVSSRIAALND